MGKFCDAEFMTCCNRVQGIVSAFKSDVTSTLDLITKSKAVNRMGACRSNGGGVFSVGEPRCSKHYQT